MLKLKFMKTQVYNNGGKPAQACLSLLHKSQQGANWFAGLKFQMTAINSDVKFFISCCNFNLQCPS